MYHIAVCDDEQALIIELERREAGWSFVCLGIT